MLAPTKVFPLVELESGLGACCATAAKADKEKTIDNNSVFMLLGLPLQVKVIVKTYPH